MGQGQLCCGMLVEGAEPEPAASATGSSMRHWAGGSLTGTQAPPCCLSSRSGEYAEKRLFCLFPDCAELSDITAMVPVIARVTQQPVLKPRPSTGSCTARPRGSPTAPLGRRAPLTPPEQAGGSLHLPLGLGPMWAPPALAPHVQLLSTFPYTPLGIRSWS